MGLRGVLLPPSLPQWKIEVQTVQTVLSKTCYMEFHGFTVGLGLVVASEAGQSHIYRENGNCYVHGNLGVDIRIMEKKRQEHGNYFNGVI